MQQFAQGKMPQPGLSQMEDNMGRMNLGSQGNGMRGSMPNYPEEMQDQ